MMGIDDWQVGLEYRFGYLSQPHFAFVGSHGHFLAIRNVDRRAQIGKRKGSAEGVVYQTKVTAQVEPPAIKLLSRIVPIV
jgi:hypothetical protein